MEAPTRNANEEDLEMNRLLTMQSLMRILAPELEDHGDLDNRWYCRRMVEALVKSTSKINSSKKNTQK